MNNVPTNLPCLGFPCNQVLQPKSTDDYNLILFTLPCSWPKVIHVSTNNHFPKAANTKAESKLLKLISSINAFNIIHKCLTHLDLLISHVCNVACFLDQQGSVGISVLQPCKSLWKISINYPSSLLHVILSVLFNKDRGKLFVRDRHNIQTY